MDINARASTSAYQVERMLLDLRRGLPVILVDHGVPVAVLPLEHLDHVESQAWVAGDGNRPALVLTRHRLLQAGLRMAPPVGRLVPLNGATFDLGRLQAQAFGTSVPDDGYFGALEPADTADQAAIALARRARLIPAALTVRLGGQTAAAAFEAVRTGELLAGDAGATLGHADSTVAELRRISEARVPLAEAEDARFVVFRESFGLREHVAVLIGAQHDWLSPPPVRVHSSCLTGDLFASLRCDCGEQLRTGVARIEALGGGVLLYLSQEGRNIGLANKLRAYTLQDAGRDTVDADAQLGFADDERDYRVAIAMLSALGLTSIRLLTNNPAKVAAMRDGGIEVDREALYGRVTAENRRYLDAKTRRSGHLLREFLDR
jgi:GTP cyclohydrolase II